MGGESDALEHGRRLRSEVDLAAVHDGVAGSQVSTARTSPVPG
jgi:hypothetical protein